MATETGIEATIKVVEPTGSETHVAVELDGRELTWVVGDRVELRASKRSGSLGNGKGSLPRPTDPTEGWKPEGARTVRRALAPSARQFDCSAGDRLDKPACIWVLRVADDLLCRSLLDDLAEIEHINSLGDLSQHSEIVRDEEV